MARTRATGLLAQMLRVRRGESVPRLQRDTKLCRRQSVFTLQPRFDGGMGTKIVMRGECLCPKGWQDCSGICVDV